MSERASDLSPWNFVACERIEDLSLRSFKNESQTYECFSIATHL
jgi:hypothetical protein